MAISSGVDISEVPGYHLLQQMSSQWGSQKLLQGLVSHEPTAYLSVYDLFLTQWIMAILSYYWKDVNQTTLNHTTLWNLALWISEDFNQILLIMNLSLNQLSWHSCSMWNKLGWLNWFWQFLCEVLSSFNPKGFYYSYVWCCSLCEERTSFCTGLISRKLSGFLLMFLTGFTSISVLLIFPVSITFFVFMHSFWFYFIQHIWGSLNQPIC